MTTPDQTTNHVQGNQTNITGDVSGNILSGTFQEHVNINNNYAAPRPPAPPAFQVPYFPAQLVGREAELAELSRLLLANQPVALTPAIAGMGGVGKTMLAATFAREHQADFPGGIFWLNMEQPDLIAGQVAACAGPDGFDLPEYDQLTFEQRQQRVKAAWNNAERRLLIFDNLEDPALLRQWRPTGTGCRVLITTRRDDWPRQIQRLRLPVLPRTQSIELLLGARAEDLGRSVANLLQQPETAQEADIICELLGDLPLAIAIAAAFLRQNPSTTLRYYRTQIEADPLTHEHQIDSSMQEILAEAGLPTGRERGIIATFAISYQQLHASDLTDRLALTMLHAAAYCAPAPIPQAILWHVGKVAGDTETERMQRDAALRRLRAIGLFTIESEGEPPAVILHRLIAAYLRSISPDENALPLLCEALTDTSHTAVNSGYPRQSAPLLPHLLYVQTLLPSESTSQLGDLLHALGRVQEQQINYPQALPLYQRALAIAETTLGLQHPTTRASLNNLAILHQNMGNYPQALPLLERALAIAEQVQGPQHPETGARLNNLAMLHKDMGNYPQALPLLERALAIAEQVQGPQHPETGARLNNLARLHQAMGNYPQALPLYQRALAIAEQAQGPQHPETGARLNNLAMLHKDMGNYPQALPLYQRALAIAEQAQGPSHPDTGTRLNNLAGLYRVMGDYPAAVPLVERALAIAEATLGPQHPTTGTCLNNLAILHQAMGNYPQALPLYLRALAIAEATQGPQHPETGTCLNNLAILHQAMGNYLQAVPLYQRALAIAEATQGPQHPETGKRLNNLASLLQDMGDYPAAIPLFQRALAIFEQALGNNHPNTRSVHDHLAALNQPRQTREHQIAVIAAQAEAAVTEALTDPTIDRNTLSATLEEAARRAEEGEQAGSPYLALAQNLRALAARLEVPPTPPTD